MKFIFEVHVKPGHTAEEYADIWVRASKVIQQAPGARGTYLHRKIGDPNVLVAIATWDTKAHRDAKDDKRGELIRAILQEAAGKVDIKVIGEFEEPEWIVPPGQQCGRRGLPSCKRLRAALSIALIDQPPAYTRNISRP